MTYQTTRDKTEALGNIFHYFVGAREAAQAAAAQANKAKAEYEQGLVALMDELGISRELVGHVSIQWHTGVVTLRDPLVPMPSDGAVPV